MTEEDITIHSNAYERFIRNAFQCYHGEHGADSGTIKFLLIEDNGKQFLVNSYDKQLKQVKGDLIKAIDKFLARKPTETERLHLEQMKLEVTHAVEATELVQPIQDGLDATQRFQGF